MCIRDRTEIGATKRKKIRTVDFCDTLAEILRTAKIEQHKNRFRYGELYTLNFYSEVKEKDRTYYEVYSLPRTEQAPEGYKEISFVCIRPDGAYEAVSYTHLPPHFSGKWNKRNGCPVLSIKPGSRFLGLNALKMLGRKRK